jgi:polyhydroxybutyrate depolymerase
MSSLLACAMPERIAAIAPIAGVEFPPPCVGRPMPVVAFHGTADPIVPYGGGGLNAQRIADTEYYAGKLPPGLPPPLGVDDSMRLWADHNGCDPNFSDVAVAPHVKHRTWPHCAAATELYIVDGGGHAWPGKPVPAFEAQFGPGTTEIDADSLMMTLFGA